MKNVTKDELAALRLRVNIGLAMQLLDPPAQPHRGRADANADLRPPPSSSATQSQPASSSAVQPPSWLALFLVIPKEDAMERDIDLATENYDRVALRYAALPESTKQLIDGYIRLLADGKPLKTSVSIIQAREEPTREAYKRYLKITNMPKNTPKEEKEEKEGKASDK